MQQIVLGVGLVAALVLFVWGRWRYDLVALMTLLAMVVVGVVPAEAAFVGFGHPAVVAVAAVLVVSRGLTNSGVVGLLGRGMSLAGDKPTAQVLMLTVVTAVCSGVMNNVGALAILMPVAVQMARGAGRSPSYLLMPIAFGSLLGGMTTLIGTPPNIIVSTYRADSGAGGGFSMFSFLAVGGAVTLAGCLFCGLIGWRLIPRRDPSAGSRAMFEIDAYIVELRVVEGAKGVGMTVRELGEKADDATIVGISKGDQQVAMPSWRERLEPGDIVLIEGDPESVQKIAASLGFELEGDRALRDALLGSVEDVIVTEAIVQPGGSLEGRTASQLNLRRGAGINILGVSRQGKRVRRRLRDIRLRGGDVLLLQGETGALAQVFESLGMLPLARRDLGVARPRRSLLAGVLFGAGILTTVLGLLPVEVAFACSACAMLLSGLLSLREAYEAIDWPVILLLGAMIPVGMAMETTGAAGTVAGLLLEAEGTLPAWGLLCGLILITMTLSNVINNAAAALLMAPIAISLANGIGASADPFLMGISVGASAAFMTPIGHQSNTLVMGPGGYRFGDYWRLGLPVSIIVVLVAVPMILVVWPM